MIRKMEEKDIPDVLQIWLETNIRAHNFIEKEYWTGNYEMVKQILPEAEVYVYEDEKNGQIVGFIGMNNQYVEGLFVKESAQSRGIGKQLLDYAKSRKTELRLGVYQKNVRAMRFYLRDNLSRTKISRKAHFSRVTEVVECCQMCWNLHQMQHICSRYATKILICIGHFSVEILGNVLFCAFLQAVQQTVNILR